MFFEKCFGCFQTTESHGQRQWELTEMCSQKDEMISRLQTALDHHVETTAQDVSVNLKRINVFKKQSIWLWVIVIVYTIQVTNLVQWINLVCFCLVADFQRSQIDSIKKEIIHLKSICTCSEHRLSSRTDTRKRRQEGEGIDGQPPLKKGTDQAPTAEKCLPAFVTTRAGRENRVKSRRYVHGRKRLSGIKK